MDDFVISNLHESRNEWCSRLVSIFTPLVIDGMRSIFNESWKICADNDEMNKYLMTFQNLLSRVPKWNNNIIEDERKRIIERSGCDYLEDLITCVHIIQLKVLTCIRVGSKQKKIDISIPDLDTFIHKVYINTARKVYSNVYLFEKNLSPLQLQKNNRELENIVQECIMLAIRESIPTEAIIRAYMDENVEHEEQVFIEDVEENKEENNEVKQTEKEEENVGDDTNNKEEESIPEVVPSIQNVDNEDVVTKLTFNDVDSVLQEDNKIDEVEAPKSLERLEDLTTSRMLERKLEEEPREDFQEEDDDEERIQISTEPVDLSGFDIIDDSVGKVSSEDILLNDIEAPPPL
uniref:Uncharacterized protein n=1 Tax=viral metagenome TaxID=1070528 RepID=A0A6C0F9J8_9ZZZZ|tara:strand:+ start:50576 stop:51619 length:1044 start_codon:yes stop_codon:yes gene_type:complete